MFKFRLPLPESCTYTSHIQDSASAPVGLYRKIHHDLAFHRAGEINEISAMSEWPSPVCSKHLRRRMFPVESHMAQRQNSRRMLIRNAKNRLDEALEDQKVGDFAFTPSSCQKPGYMRGKRSQQMHRSSSNNTRPCYDIEHKTISNLQYIILVLSPGDCTLWYSMRHGIQRSASRISDTEMDFGHRFPIESIRAYSLYDRGLVHNFPNQIPYYFYLRSEP